LVSQEADWIIEKKVHRGGQRVQVGRDDGSAKVRPGSQELMKKAMSWGQGGVRI
jgi:hypothetical protein